MSEHDDALWSPLLAPYLRGELGASEERELTEHLAGCPVCRSELRALEVMGVAEAVPTELELARMRRNVLDAVRAEGAPVPGRVARRVGPWLGAAATVALLLFAATQITLSGGDDEGGAGLTDSAESESFDAGDGGGTAGGGGRAQPDRVRNEGRTSDSAKDAGTEEDFAALPQPSALGTEAPAGRPFFGGRDVRFTRTRLRRLGSEGQPFVSFSRRFKASQDADRRDAFVERLVKGRKPEVSDQIRSCSDRFFEGKDYPVLPAYAALGSFDSSDVLVLGFVYTTSSSGPFDRYAFGIWPRSECDFFDLLGGRIQP